MAAEVIALGSRLRQRREQLGLSQAQAARELEVARTAYRLWEMEAARPAPDRWRTIASWLGISMTAMLLAEELIDEQEAHDARHAATASGLSELEWDAGSDESAGDFFSQERSMIANRTRSGDLSTPQAASLGRVLSRIQQTTLSHEPSPWYPANFHKRFPNDPHAVALARSAVAATAVGIPADAFDTAVLLISELVTNSVKYTDSDWVAVAITLDADLLRIQVSDQSTQAIRPRTPDHTGGWGLTLVAELATRWGVERHKTGKTIWVDLDLTRPT